MITARQAVALLKNAGATPALCHNLPSVALDEAIRAVMLGQDPRVAVELMHEAAGVRYW